MRRLLLTSAGALMLAGCGGESSSAVGANSAESTEITAVGTVVNAVPSPSLTPTPTETPTPEAVVADNAAADAAAVPDTASHDDSSEAPHSETTE